MAGSPWANVPRSIFWPQVGVALLDGEFVVRAHPSTGVAAMQLASNIAQAALSLTPIDPRIMCWNLPGAWRAMSFLWAVFCRPLSLFTELRAMKRISPIGVGAKVRMQSRFTGRVAAHPGVD
jgi:hypothetical protein